MTQVGYFRAYLTRREICACADAIRTVTVDNMSLLHAWRIYYAAYGCIPVNFNILRMSRSDYQSIGTDPETNGPDFHTNVGMNLGSICRDGPNRPQRTCRVEEWLNIQPEFLTVSGAPTLIRSDVNLLSYDTQALGCILMHEFVHTHHLTTETNHGPREGEAYGVEYFFALRCCLELRARGILDVLQRQYGDGRDAFMVSFGTLRILYASIDNRPHRDFPSLSSDQARRIATDYITAGASGPGRVNEIVSYVRRNLSTYSAEVASIERTLLAR